MGKGLPIETQKPVIEMVARADMACNIGHADFAYYPKTVQHTDKTVIKGDTYMGEETVDNLNKLTSKKEIHSGWHYKITGASGGLVNNQSTGSTTYVKAEDIVVYKNGVWTCLYRYTASVIHTYIGKITEEQYAVIAGRIDSGVMCFAEVGRKLYPIDKMPNGVLRFDVIMMEMDPVITTLFLVKHSTYYASRTSTSWRETSVEGYVLPEIPSDGYTHTLKCNKARKIYWQ